MSAGEVVFDWRFPRHYPVRPPEVHCRFTCETVAASQCPSFRAALGKTRSDGLRSVSLPLLSEHWLPVYDVQLAVDHLLALVCGMGESSSEIAMEDETTESSPVLPDPTIAAGTPAAGDPRSSRTGTCAT